MTTTTFDAGTSLQSVQRGPIERPQIARFAAATQDFNPIHTDEAFAQKIGFPSVIAHGPMSLAFVAQLLGHNFGAENVRGLSVQFRAPVLPGDVLRAEGEVTEVTEVDGERRAVCDVRVVKGESEVVVKGTGQAAIEG
jgi:acyl dehydratase